jgi:hypothetical protein
VTEKNKKISNPLTIIGIFASLAEISSIGVLPLIGQELQQQFIWFVMGFPTFLIVSFFITLNFNPRVLYAPSDFRDENNFLDVIGITKQAESDLTQLSNDLELFRAEVVEKLSSTQSREEVENLINSNIRLARGNIALQTGRISEAWKPLLREEHKICPECKKEALHLRASGDEWHCKYCGWTEPST